MRTEIYSTKRAYPHRRQPGPQLSVARLVWRAARNGLYRKELRQVLSAIGRYLAAHQLPQERARLAVRWAIWHRGRAGGLGWLLVRDARQRVRRAGSSSRPGASAPAERLSSSVVLKASLCAASTTARMCLWDPRACIAAWWWRPIQPAKRRAGLASRVRASSTNSSSPSCREPPFTASDVVELYLHRGAFETALADEDQEQATSRWCSHSAAGQELWQVISQWVWNLRLELGHQLHPDPVRTTEFAPAHLSAKEQQALSPAPAQGYGPIAEALPWKQGRFVFARLCSPARWHAPLSGRAAPARPRAAQRSRWEPACGLCGQRPQLPPLSSARAVSMAGPSHHKAAPGEHAVASPRRWVCSSAASRDWNRRHHRRACIQLLRKPHVEVQVEQGFSASPTISPAPLSRAQRAHYRLDFQERLARNARAPTASRVMIRLFGVPEGFATSLGLATA